MKDLLHPRHRAALARFVDENTPARVLLAFDYDGVLAPVVRDPHGAPMRPTTRRLLRRLAELYPVAVVSGRAWRDVERFVGDAVPLVVGNHGFELGEPVAVPERVLRRVRGWRRRLEAALDGVPGIHFEDKRSTLAIHYGLARTWRVSERAVYEAANQLEGTRLIAGKKVLNVLPHDFPSKGDAVRALLSRLGCDAALYAGDDVTDEDAFAVGAPLVFGVHVGSGQSLAPWRIREQREVDVLLARLVALAEAAPAEVERARRRVPAAAAARPRGADRARARGRRR
ncbi:trehalose-phosphatase [Anaeromyxobacter sp. Fw109-5]|uniref:trehalose-phosphatase n=1 Tax=Anaeromyxobacter sp. (strain Fw109-5) TaxID=404589 RepID=UPI0000ED7F55|nr:trehalose-phosphatase [Anaeromyxobacter sp. Fw109-5]ABS25339.1 HAD-superfamily hydrolase, subfamily IIB [Anaeromyxobacter sp. Fw109-5]